MSELEDVRRLSDQRPPVLYLWSRIESSCSANILVFRDGGDCTAMQIAALGRSRNRDRIAEEFPREDRSLLHSIVRGFYAPVTAPHTVHWSPIITPVAEAASTFTPATAAASCVTPSSASTGDTQGPLADTYGGFDRLRRRTSRRRRTLAQDPWIRYAIKFVQPFG